MVVYADRVKETSATSGTGSLDLDGAPGGFQTFVAGAGDAAVVYYCISSANDWEVGSGTVNAGAGAGGKDQLTRTTVQASSNGGAKVVWPSGGSRDVTLVVPAARGLPFMWDADGDTGVEVERTADIDIVHVKAGGTDVAQFSASGLSFDGGTSHLNDYSERQSWTPTITFGGASVGITYADNAGRWSRIGNRIFIDGTISMSAKGSSTGTAQIAGLPATSYNHGGNSTSIIHFGNYTSLIDLDVAGGRYTLVGGIGTNSAIIALQEIGDNVLPVNITDADFSNTSSLYFSGSFDV